MTLREIAAIGMYRRGFVHGLKFSCKDCGRCEKQAENAKIREALEIILAFRTSPAKWLEINEMYHKAYDAVRKAQTIMKESKTNDFVHNDK